MTASRASEDYSYGYVNKDSLCTFYHSLFSDHFDPMLLPFQVLLFVQLRRHFIYCILLQAYTWELGRLRAGGKFKGCPVFIHFWPLG